MTIAAASLEADHAKSHDRFYAWAVVVIALLALLLRIAGASGSLWLDEIWSLQNLEGLHNAGEIFWGISQDNNHFLNSLWLWIVGPAASPLVMRLMSIFFGVATIPLAARIGQRIGGNAAALAAAAIFSFSYIFVHYGSEARGYAGMVFALVWAWDALSHYVDDPSDDRARLIFGLAVTLGALSQLSMLPAVAALYLAAIAQIAARTRSFRTSLNAGLRLASAAIFGAAPGLICIGAGIFHTHEIRIGNQDPFTVANWIEGVAGMLRALLGLPDSLGDNFTLGLGIALVGLATCLVPPACRWFPLALAVMLPSLEALTHLSNLEVVRFHLAAAVGLSFLCSYAFAVAWSLRGGTRAIAIAVLVLMFVGNAMSILTFLHFGRGAYAQAVARMGASGSATYTSNYEPETVRTVRFFASREAVTLTGKFVHTCPREAPDWFILTENNRKLAPPEDHLQEGPAACQALYEFDSVFAYRGLSGFRWVLYRRVS